jgi:hypothetical protein
VDAGLIAVAANKEIALWIPMAISLFRPEVKISQASEEMRKIFGNDQI